jgi:predicted MFS family arabinose efflux permease
MFIYVIASFNESEMEQAVANTGRGNTLKKATRATRMTFFISGLAMASWAPMVPYARARLALDDADLGLVLLAFGGGSMLSMPLVGWLANRYGNDRVIGVAGALMCLALPMLAVVPTVATLAIALLFFGAMLGAVDVAMNAHAVEVERMHGRAVMSGFHGLFSLGGLAGAAAMSAMLACGFPLLACALSIAVVIALIVASQQASLLRMPTPARAVEIDSTPTPVFRLPRGSLLLVGALCFVSFLAEGSMLDWSALLLRDFRGYSAASAGLGYACFSVAMATGRLTGDRLIASLGPVWTVRAGATLAATGFLISALLPWHATALTGFVLVGLGAANVVPVMFSAAGRLPNVPPAISIAAVTTLGYAGLLLGPALIGFVAHATSLPAALAAVAILLLLVAASARVVRR